MCSAEITLTDKDTGEVITLGEMDLNISSPLMDITFTNERMAKDRLYRVMVNASNINGSAIFISDISKLLCCCVGKEVMKEVPLRFILPKCVALYSLPETKHSLEIHFSRNYCIDVFLFSPTPFRYL